MSRAFHASLEWNEIHQRVCAVCDRTGIQPCPCSFPFSCMLTSETLRCAYSCSHTHTHTKCLYTGWNFYFVALTLRLLSFLCVFSGASIKNVATLLLSAVAMRGPAALPFLCLALWAERLLGFCPGQHGCRDDHGNDEGSWRGFSWRSVPSRNTHMPLWLPVPSQGRPVFWSRLVSVWEGNRASVCICVKLCLHFTVCECGRKFRKGNKIVVLLVQTLHNIYEPFFRVGGRGFLHWDNGGIFWQGKACLWGIWCSRLWGKLLGGRGGDTVWAEQSKDYIKRCQE